MNIPNKLYIEVRGEILEYDFIEKIHNEEEDVMYFHYSDNLLISIPHWLESKDNFKEHFLRSLYLQDLWLNKEGLIKSKIESYNKSIKHYEIRLEKSKEYLNKLLQL